MRAFCLAISISTVFAAITARAGSCEVASLPDAPPSLAERARVVRFKDNRQIVVIGQVHGDRAMSNRLKYQLEMFIRDASGDRATLLERFLNYETQQEAQSIQHAKEELAFLKTYSPLKNPDFIQAIEAVGDSISAIRKEIVDRYGLVQRAKGKTDLRNPTRAAEQLEDLALVSSGSLFYRRIVDPETRTEGPIRGFEDAEAGRISDAAIAKLNAHLAVRRPDSTFVHELNRAGDRYFETMGVPDAPLAPGEVPEPFRDVSVSEEDRAVFEARVSAYVDLKRSIQDRDARTARNIAATKRSGLLTVGLAHLESLTKKLKTECEAAR